MRLVQVERVLNTPWQVEGYKGVSRLYQPSGISSPFFHAAPLPKCQHNCHKQQIPFSQTVVCDGSRHLVVTGSRLLRVRRHKIKKKPLPLLWLYNQLPFG